MNISRNYNRKPYSNQSLIDCSLSLLSNLSYLFYLQRFESLSYAITYGRIRKTQKLAANAFKAIYKACVKQRGEV